MNKQEWSDELKQLHSIIRKEDRLEEAKEIILKLHAMTFSSVMSNSKGTTFEDQLFQGLTDITIRTALNKKNRTILYGLWHSSRIEDITMNLLVSGNDQIFERKNWFDKINPTIRHTGNSLDKDGILQLSSQVDIEALKEYRNEVGRNSESIIKSLSRGDMKRKIYKDNLKRIIKEGAVDDVDSANWLIDFWGKKDVAGIILMPCLRHQLIHLNESMQAASKKFI